MELNLCYDLMCSASQLLISSFPGLQLHRIWYKLKQYLHSHCSLWLSLWLLNVTFPLNMFRLCIYLLLLCPLIEVEGAPIQRGGGGFYWGKKSLDVWRLLLSSCTKIQRSLHRSLHALRYKIAIQWDSKAGVVGGVNLLLFYLRNYGFTQLWVIS